MIRGGRQDISGDGAQTVVDVLRFVFLSHGPAVSVFEKNDDLL